MNKFKKVAIFVVLTLFAFALSACSGSSGVLDHIELAESFRSSYDIDTFEISDIELLLVYVAEEGENPETETIPLTLSMVKAEDHVKFGVIGTHTINIIYRQKTFAFELVITKGIADKFKVTFLSDDNTELRVEYVDAGAAATPPQIPAKEEYTFIYWATSTGQQGSYDMISEDTVLYAYYEWDYCLVTFRMPNSDVIDTVKIKKGATVSAPTPPEVSGETFISWSRSLSGITVDTNIFAQYQRNTIKVSFVYGADGRSTETHQYPPGDKIPSAPVNPSVTHAEFLGWYTNEEYKGSPVTFPYILNTEITFYAKYVSKTVGSSGLIYTASGSGYMVSGYTGSDSIVVIPEKYMNANVVGVDARAFRNTSNVSFSVSETNQYLSVVNGVLFDVDRRNLYAYPSGKSEPLYSVPSSVVSISAYAFYSAKNLMEIRWGSTENLTVVGESAFEDCTGLVSFTLPKSVVSIGNAAFKMTEMSALASFSFGAGSALELIGNEAFFGLSKLTKITLPEEKLNSIGENLFGNCSQLYEINIDITNESFLSVRGVLYSKDGKTLLYYPQNNMQTANAVYTVEDGTENISSSAFVDANISGVNIPASVTSIAADAFNSIKIKFVVFNSEVPPVMGQAGTSIFSGNTPVLFVPVGKVDAYGFGDEYDVREGTGLNNYYYDMESGFIYSKSLTNEITIHGLKPSERIIDIIAYTKNITVPSQIDGYPVVSIGAYAFYANKVLETLVISEGVASIMEYAFWYADSLRSVTLPSTLITIEKGVFADCENLAAVTYLNEIAIESIGDEAFVNTKWYESSSEEYLILGNVLVRYNGYGLEAELPDYIRVIAHSAFMDKSNLKKITLNSSLERIDSFAFYGCTGLFYIDIPASVKYIGNSAFLYCDNLFSVSIRAFSPPEMPLGTDIFPVGAKTTGTGINAQYQVGNKVFSFEILTPNAATATVYKNAAGWDKYQNYIYYVAERQITFHSDNSNYQYTVNRLYDLFIPDSTSNVHFGGWYDNDMFSGSPLMFPITTENLNSTLMYARWLAPEDGSAGLEYIESAAGDEYYVSGYTGTDTYVIVPQTYKNKIVTKILSGAFSIAKSSNNAFVYHLSIPATVTEIEENALNETYWYKQFLGDYIYINDILLDYKGTSTTVEVPSDIRYIMKGAFKNNSFIQTITFPEFLYTLPESVLEGCINLTTVNFSSNLLIIRERAFAGCIRLAGMQFPTTLTEIASDAFENTLWLNNYSEDCVMINTVFYKYKGKQSTLHIPSVIKISDTESYAVTKIEKEAFKNNVYLQSVFISSSISVIGESAFEGCTSLQNVQMAENSLLTDICDRAFYGCIMLVNFSIEENNQIDMIGEEAFAECMKLSKLDISASLSKLGERAFMSSGISYLTIASDSLLSAISASAFMNCVNLRSVSIGAGGYLTSIEASAFEGCINLKSVVIADNVKLGKIAMKAFYDCQALVYSELPASLKEIGEDAFKNVPFMSTGANDILRVGSVLLSYTGMDSVVVISKEIAAIGKDAFKGNTNIKEIVFEAGSELFSIGEGAFADCVNLESVSPMFPLGLTEIGKNAFSNTKWMDSFADEYVVINSVLVRYKEKAGVYQAVIPENVTTIAENAFENCSQLQNIVVGSRVSIINAGAFDTISPEATMLMLPAAPPTLVGSHNIVNRIYVETNAIAAAYNENPVWNAYNVTVIDKYSVSFNLGTEVLQYKNAKLTYEGQNVTVISTAALYAEPTPELEGYSFAGWYLTFNDGYMRYEGDALSDKVSFPLVLTKNITVYAKWINNESGSSFGSFIFDDLAYDEGVTEEGRYITHVKTVDDVVIIPAEYAGETIVGISKNSDVLIQQNELAARLESDIFFKLDRLDLLSAGVGKVVRERIVLDNFSDMSSIIDTYIITALGEYGIENAAQINRASINVSYNDTIYTLQTLSTHLSSNNISGIAVFSVSYTSPAPVQHASFTVVYVDRSSISVSYDGESCSLNEMKSKLNSSAIAISSGTGVFEVSFEGNTFEIAISVTYEAFANKSGIKTVMFTEDSQLKYIMDGAFENCTSLERIVLPSSLVYIGENAFKGCINLQSVEFADGGNENLVIGANAFSNCTQLSKIVLPENLNQIGNNAFSSSLASVEFLSANPPVVGDALFVMGTEIIVPDAAYNAYVSAFGDYEGTIKRKSEVE